MSSTVVRDAMARITSGLPAGGEDRPGQLEMALAVAAAIADRRHLVVRAGTGTGKSLAYLVPALALRTRCVVATATKALQDQLAAKDLPLVLSRLGHEATFAVLKGRSNYICRQRVVELGLAPEPQRLVAPGEEAAGSEESADLGPLGAEVTALAAWAATTETGDRAELEFEPRPRAWASVSVSAEECPGAFRCPSGAECFAEAARRRAAEADVVVINMHLLGADVRSGGAVLPEHDLLVVDEAHELEEVLSASLGTEIRPGRLRALAAMAGAAGARGRRGRTVEGVGADLGEVAARFEVALSARAGERLPPGLGGELGDVVALARGRAQRAAAALGAIAEGAEGAVAQRARRTMLALERCADDLAGMLEAGEDDVVWVEAGERPALLKAPIDVGPVFRAQVLESRTVVFTSATVPIGLAARLGARRGEALELDVGSPFAYEEQALLYSAAHLPDRRRPEFEGALVEELEALVRAAGGRTLALFTSRSAMRSAATAIAQRVELPVLVQGDAPKAALLARFAGDPAACLFATMGFWQGVDLPGATLSLVAIDRIPFPRPDDPLIAARRERAGPGAFRVVDLPRAAALLAQGAGRLVRSATDRGVVAVLDPRLASASYRWELVRALPPMRRTRHRAEAEALLRRLHDEALVDEAAARVPQA